MRNICLLLVTLTSLTTFAQTLDENFKPEFNNPSKIIDAEYTADGKILVGGYFQQFHNTKRGGIVRLNADGTVDETFNTDGLGPRSAAGDTSPVYAPILSITVLADNKILIYGSFSYYNGERREKIARLNSDGTLDDSFNPPIPDGTGGTSENPVVVQPDGKIIYPLQRNENNSLVSKIVRLNTDGSIDESFTGPDVPGFLYTMSLQSTGKVVVTRSTNPSEIVGYVFRLNADGTLDNTFLPGIPSSIPSSSLVLPDDKILLAGSFGMYNDIAKRNIVKLNADGTIDNSFEDAETFDTYRLLMREISGTILVAAGTSKLLRLSTTGTILKTFSRVPSIRIDEGIVKALPTDDAKFLIFGYDAAAKYGFARLTADFTLDDSFNPGMGAVDRAGIMKGLFAVPGGKVMIVGDFIFYNGVRKGGLVQLKSDLAIDETFSTGTGFANPNEIMGAVAQSDGRPVLFTNASAFNNMPLAKKVIRLNTNGSVDNTFQANGSTGNIRPAIGKDDKIYIVGNDIDFAGANSTEIVRLNADGTVDNTFSSEYDDDIYWTYPLKSGKVIVRGLYTRPDNENVLDIIRLNEDGTLDTTFDPKIDRDKSEITRLIEGEDGKLLLGGYLYIKDGDDKRYWDVRLLENGDIDEEFYRYENFIGASFDGVQLSDGTYIVRNGNYDLIRFADDGYNAVNEGTNIDTDQVMFAQTDESTVYFMQEEGLRPVIDPYFVQRVTFEPLPPITTPTNLTGVASPSVITLTWTASTNAMFYDLERWNGTAWENVVILEAPATTYGDGGLDEKTEYKYRVRARGLGGVTPYSEEAVITTTVGLEDDISKIVSVYPNPAQNEVFVKGVDGKVSILDPFGRKIADHDTSHEGTSIDLSRLNTGVYFLKINSGTSVHVRKIVHH